jgi:hypothetical protein
MSPMGSLQLQHLPFVRRQQFVRTSPFLRIYQEDVRKLRAVLGTWHHVSKGGDKLDLDDSSRGQLNIIKVVINFQKNTSIFL